MNLVYVYDGSFLGLLSLIVFLIGKNVIPYEIKDQQYVPNLFEEIVSISITKDKNIGSLVIQKIGYYNFRMMYYVFLSEAEHKELVLYYFFRNGLKYHEKIGYQRNLKCVCKVLKISQYVSHEIHKLKGFLRFQELENRVLYAQMTPENNILFDLSLHFQKRLQSEYWIIHDVKRGLLSCYDKNHFLIVFEENFQFNTKNASKEEENFKMLWQIFYKTIGIKERKNERCRMNFMPKKYWKYITEVRDEL